MNAVEMGILGCVVLISLSIVLTTLIYGIGPMPSSKIAQESMKGLLPPHSKHVCILGSGWGGLAIMAANKLPKAQIVGFEVSPFPYFIAWLRIRLSNQKNISLKWANFHNHDLSGFDLAICYLFPKGMKKVQTKLVTEMPLNALVVSNTFSFESWEPETTVTLRDRWKSRVYGYRIHANSKKTSV